MSNSMANKATERHFRSPLTENTIHYWKKKQDLLKTTPILKLNLHQAAVKLPELDQEMKERIILERNSGLVALIKIILNDSKVTAALRALSDFRKQVLEIYEEVLYVNENENQNTIIMPEDYDNSIIEVRRLPCTPTPPKKKKTD